MTRAVFILMAAATWMSACTQERSAPIAASESALVTDNKLATNKIATNKLATNKLATNRLSNNKLATNRLSNNKLATNRLAGNRLAGNKIATNKIATNKLATNKIAVNKIAINKIAGNRLAGNKIATNKLAGNRLAGNGLRLNRVPSSQLDRARLAWSRFDSSRIAPQAAERIAISQLEARRVALGRLQSNRISMSRLSEVGLAASRRAANRVELDPAVFGDLLATADGREVLTYAMGCALPASQTVVATYDHVPYEFKGSLGLAPEWLVRPLDLAGQRWISACLFARVNAYGVRVEISMRGANRALTTSPDEMAAWSLEEGAFWGNYFTDGPVDWNACRGSDQASGESGWLEERDCTEPDPENPGFTLCGFKYAGDCGDFAETSACSDYDADGMYYSGCSTAGTAQSTPYREVITTFAKP
jgi:hypothetical protein